MYSDSAFFPLPKLPKPHRTASQEECCLCGAQSLHHTISSRCNHIAPHNSGALIFLSVVQLTLDGVNGKWRWRRNLCQIDGENSKLRRQSSEFSDSNAIIYDPYLRCHFWMTPDVHNTDLSTPRTPRRSDVPARHLHTSCCITLCAFKEPMHPLTVISGAARCMRVTNSS